MKCLRCGKCCHFIIDGVLTEYKCRFLITDSYYPENETTCIAWDSLDRVGIFCGSVMDDKGIKHTFNCNRRVDSPYDFPGCPYNTNKKMVKVV